MDAIENDKARAFIEEIIEAKKRYIWNIPFYL